MAISKKEWAFLEKKTRRNWHDFKFGPGFQVEKVTKPRRVKMTADDKFVLSQKRIIKPMQPNEFERI